MKLSDLIALAKVRLQDDSGEKLWSDESLSGWANEAHIEACRRLRYLADNSLTVSVTAGKSDYEYPDNVIFVRRAKLSSEDRPLRFTSYKSLDEDCPGWEDHTGTPLYIVTDFKTDTFYLYPKPDVSGTLKLTAIMEPDKLVAETDIPNRLSYGLVNWILGRAYQVKDPETFDIQKSEDHFARFDVEYGPRSSARDEVYNFRNRPFDNFDGDY